MKPTKEQIAEALAIVKALARGIYHPTHSHRVCKNWWKCRSCGVEWVVGTRGGPIRGHQDNCFVGRARRLVRQLKGAKP